MTKWTRCSEEMPASHERKLVISKDEGICTAMYLGYWDLDPKGDYATGGFIGGVTHWAELPPGPA